MPLPASRLRRLLAARHWASRLRWRLRVASGRETAPEPLRARVVERFPHDRNAFTQGLVLADGWLYESTGGYGDSTLRRVDLPSGRVDAVASLPDDLFGEGLARVGERLVQLTWRERRALVWDLATLELVDVLHYDREGWGLCWDGSNLVASDGSNALTFRDPERLAPRGRVRVTHRGRPLPRLNDLEHARGALYANLWGSDWLARVDPASGRVTGFVDATHLLPRDRRRPDEVLNGVAHDPASGHLLLTGKRWPHLFEVAVEPAT